MKKLSILLLTIILVSSKTHVQAQYWKNTGNGTDIAPGYNIFGTPTGNTTDLIFNRNGQQTMVLSGAYVGSSALVPYIFMPGMLKIGGTQSAVSSSLSFDLTGYGGIRNNYTLEFGVGTPKAGTAGKIGYQYASDALDIFGAGSSNSNMKIKFWNSGGAYFTGNIGVGVAAPEELLHVAGNIRANSAVLYDDNSNAALSYNAKYIGTVDKALRTSTGFSGQLLFSYTDGSFAIRNTKTSSAGGGTLTWSYPFSINNNGQVKIGSTVHPTHKADYKLSVDGKIVAQSVYVRAFSEWVPDYVFAPDYKLTPLDEVEKYIKKNKHLEGVPSATEVEEKGQDVGEMNLILLRKVEELTLYMIEMKKENEELKKKIDKIK